MPHPPAIDAELDCQADVLVALGYPALTGLAEEPFRALVEPLRPLLHDRLSAASADPAPAPDRAAFVLVVNGTLVAASARVPLVALGGRQGLLSRHFGDVDTFRPVIDVPEAPVYALLDVERGEEFCDVSPADAVAVITSRGRSAITIEEGLSLLHASPSSLEPNRCFHTAASRGRDRRVPALWIADRAPMLGWCWEGNHHTWLGVASAGARLAA